jgi:hypothetical protein
MVLPKGVLHTNLHTGYKHHFFEQVKTQSNLYNTHMKENTQEIHEIRHGHVACSRKKHSFQLGTIV